MSLKFLGGGNSSATSRPTAVNGPAACSIPPPPNLSSTGFLGGNSRVRYVVPQATPRLEVQYANWVNSAGVEADGPNAYSVRASIEYPVGVFTPLYFRGLRDVTIDGGAQVASDPAAVSIPAGATIYVRTVFTVATTSLKFPMVAQPLQSALGEGGSVGASAPTDITTSGTVTPSDAYTMTPFGVRGLDMAPGTASLLLAGDSIMYGYADSVGTRGWTGLAFDGALAYVKLAYSSERADMWNVVQGRRRRMALATGANVAICAYGVNDIGKAGATFASVQAALQATWATLATPGTKVFQTTLTPRTTSTDNWATPGNQAVTGTESIRTQINDWIRTKPTGIDGVIELADAVEVNAAGTATRNGGRWPTTGSAQGYTIDGLHPNNAGFVLLAVPAAAAISAIKSAVA